MVEVRYHCPRCGTVVALERDAYLADKSVTPTPLSGWTYAGPAEDYEAEDVDGVRLVCGASPPGADLAWQGEGCGEPFYLNFVRYRNGREVRPVPEREYVRLAGREAGGPGGPRGPGGPGGPPVPG